MLLRLTTVVVTFLVWAPVANAWSWPVHGAVLQPFSYDEAHPNSSGQHRGIDIAAAATGEPVVAPESGTVSFAGSVPTSGESLTIETADGYSVTLTHLGSIDVAEGATVAEGDVVATVGPSGTPEQTVPYVQLGVRLSSDPLGYVDPLGLLPAPETPAPPPTPAPQPVSKAVPVAKHPRGGGSVIEEPVVAPQTVAARAEPSRAANPTRNPKPRPSSRPKPAPAPAADTFRIVASHVRRPVIEPVADRPSVVAPGSVRAPQAEFFVLSIAPGIVAALLALATACTRGRRRAPPTARVIAFRKEPPLRRAA